MKWSIPQQAATVLKLPNEKVSDSGGKRAWSKGVSGWHRGYYSLMYADKDPYYAKHLCEMSGEQVASRASATAKLVDWFLAEVAS
jgi:hypothetical protein